MILTRDLKIFIITDETRHNSSNVKQFKIETNDLILIQTINKQKQKWYTTTMYNKWQKKEKSLLSNFRHVHNLAGFNIRTDSKPSTKPWSLVQQNKLCKTITETDAVYMWCLRAENKIEVHLAGRKQRYLKYWSTIFFPRYIMKVKYILEITFIFASKYCGNWVNGLNLKIPTDIQALKSILSELRYMFHTTCPITF